MTAMSYGLVRRALLALALTAGCAPAPSPKVAAAFDPSPRLVPAPARPACNAKRLATVAPWAGAIVARAPSTRTVRGRRLVREEWALCGALPAEGCWDWARNTATERGRREHLSVEVSQGAVRHGELWTFELDRQNVALLFQDNQELVRWVRSFDGGSIRPAILDRAQVVEPRFHRMVVRYYDEDAPEVPGSTWSFRFDHSERDAGDALLAIEDLEREGIDLDAESRADLSDAVREAGSGIVTLPYIGPASPLTGPPVTVELRVHCHVD